MRDWKKYHAIKAQNEKRIRILFPKLTNASGIYMMVRFDEDGFKYAYIGQAVKIFDRVVGHLSGYQHIDLSIKKHGLYDSEANPTGWKVSQYPCAVDKLDDFEEHYIKEYHKKGFQLHNKTSGRQSEGKSQIAEYKPAKGYHEGLAQGEENARRFIANLFEKHMNYAVKKEGHKTQERMKQKFEDWMKGETDESN